MIRTGFKVGRRLKAGSVVLPRGRGEN